MARAKKKNPRAITLGPSKRTATAGIFAKFTPTIHKVLAGARTNDSRTLGRICVPVRISQPAFTTDHVHIAAATISTNLMTHLFGHLRQTSDKRTSIAKRNAMSTVIQSKYSSVRSFRQAWKNLTAIVQNKAPKTIML